MLTVIPTCSKNFKKVRSNKTRQASYIKNGISDIYIYGIRLSDTWVDDILISIE